MDQEMALELLDMQCLVVHLCIRLQTGPLDNVPQDSGMKRVWMHNLLIDR
jgi:hypothetical protein